MDSAQYIYQQSRFSGFHLQDTSCKGVGSVLEQLGAFAGLFRDSGGVGACSCFRMASGKASGWCLEEVLRGQSCFLAVLFVFGDGFLDPSQKAVVVVALCASHTHLKHFSSQLNVSTTSWVSRMCRSAIPLTWVTCHANMSVCMNTRLRVEGPRA